jgi:hypothetical protein
LLALVAANTVDTSVRRSFSIILSTFKRKKKKRGIDCPCESFRDKVAQKRWYAVGKRLTTDAMSPSESPENNTRFGAESNI